MKPFKIQGSLGLSDYRVVVPKMMLIDSEVDNTPIYTCTSSFKYSELNCLKPTISFFIHTDIIDPDRNGVTISDCDKRRWHSYDHFLFAVSQYFTVCLTASAYFC